MISHEFPLSAEFREAALSVAHLWDMPPVVTKYLSTGDLTFRKAAYDASNAECFRLAHAQLDAARNGTSWEGLDKAHNAAIAARSCAVEAVFNEPFAAAMSYIISNELAVLKGVQRALS